MRGRRALAAALSTWAVACAGEVIGGQAVPDGAHDGGLPEPRDDGGPPPPEDGGEAAASRTCATLSCTSHTDCQACNPILACQNGMCRPDCGAERTATGDLIVGDDTYRWGGVPAAPGPRLSLTDLAGVTVIDGSLAIVGTDLESLSALSCLREITGGLHIGSVPFCMDAGCFSFPNPELKSVAGLETLKSVGSQLVIATSPALREIGALSGLSSARSLHVTGMDSLESLHGLAGLARLTDLQITQNGALASLDGLDGLTEVSRVYVSGNAVLGNVGVLSALTEIGGQVTFSDNPLLDDLQGLRNVRSIGSGLDLTGNPRLASLAGLRALGAIGGDLRIEECPVPTLEGLEGLERAASVHLVHLPVLHSLAGLEALADLGGGVLEIRDAPRLTGLGALASLGGPVSALLLVGPSALPSLAGLDGITEVRGELQVSGHPELASVAALTSVAGAGTVRIYGNPRLPGCAAESLAARLAITCEDPLDPAEGACTGVCACPGNDGPGTCPPD